MSRKHAIAEARKNLPQLVRDAESGKSIELTRRGLPVAVLISRKDYDRLTSAHRGFSRTYAEFLREVDLRALAIDVEAVFGSSRDRTAGREPSL
jgi:prevent-host-death family protein